MPLPELSEGAKSSLGLKRFPSRKPLLLTKKVTVWNLSSTQNKPEGGTWVSCGTEAVTRFFSAGGEHFLTELFHSWVLVGGQGSVICRPSYKAVLRMGDVYAVTSGLIVSPQASAELWGS